MRCVAYVPKDAIITMVPLFVVSIAFVICALNIIPAGNVLVKSLAVLGGGLGVIGSLGMCLIAINDIRSQSRFRHDHDKESA